MEKRFEYAKKFNNCDDCPLNEYVTESLYGYWDDEYIIAYCRCKILNKKIVDDITPYGEKVDNRNSEGILDDCPFLKKIVFT